MDKSEINELINKKKDNNTRDKRIGWFPMEKFIVKK